MCAVSIRYHGAALLCTGSERTSGIAAWWMKSQPDAGTINLRERLDGVACGRPQHNQYLQGNSSLRRAPDAPESTKERVQIIMQAPAPTTKQNVSETELSCPSFCTLPLCHAFTLVASTSLHVSKHPALRYVAGKQ
jgi:hypothetical protein